MNRVILNLSLAIGLALFSVNVQAQKVVETGISYNKQNINGFVGSYNIPSKDLSTIADAYFAKNIKGKKKKNKGFSVFQGVNWPAVPLEIGDVYYSVSGKKNESSLSVMVSKGYDNFITSASDAEIAAAVQRFFTDFNKDIEAFYLAHKIEAQKELIVKLEKEHQDGLKVEEKLKKDIVSIEKDIEKNKAAYNAKAAEVEAAKKVLSELESKFK